MKPGRSFGGIDLGFFQKPREHRGYGINSRIESGFDQSIREYLSDVTLLGQIEIPVAGLLHPGIAGLNIRIPLLDQFVPVSINLTSLLSS